MLQQLIDSLSQQNKDKQIIYPDIDDSRVVQAVFELQKLWENPIVCWKKSELELYEDFIKKWWICYEVPHDEDNLIYAAKLLSEWKVDGFIAGNISTTSDTVRTLIKNVWSWEDISRISSHFFFGRDDGMMLFSDAGIQIDPDAEQLAEIWYLTIQSALGYGLIPRVAMLSFSTSGSGWDHPKALKVREATKILRERLQKKWLWDIPLEWEIQFDAAFIPEIGKRKNPETSLTQSANVFIFPDLDSANIAYKITERLAGYTALWPIIQWLAKPGNDLSRWCSVQDIIAMHHITKNQ